jgi:hypothetical protein
MQMLPAHRAVEVGMSALLFLSTGAYGLCQAPPADSSKADPVAISGYAEVYYTYDLSAPKNGERPSFLYNYRRHNEVALNLGFIKAAYNKENLRANLALMAGTYPQYNLAAEPAVMRSVFEANIGVRLGTKHDLWLDAGVLPSHIGMESAIGADCFNLSRSIWAENTPYYETGVRVTYKPVPRVALSALYLNGWQRMQRPVGHSAPCFGTQVNVTTSSGVQWNWSTFIGSATPDSVGLWRFYNNFHLMANDDTTGLALGFDIGLQQQPQGRVAGWFGPLAMWRQRLGKGWWGVSRVEFFNDEDRIILPSDRPVIGASLGADKRITKDVLWRVEARWLGSDGPAFLDGQARPTTDNWAFTTALTAKF